ncbi:MAG: RNB domain-containing ribonuclease [Betaproteobacteria bacterium]|nr:RNB domain-containing ribonuclease [Betaproteobacteria bacterium]
MYALFEEGGKFLTGRVLSEAEASAQIELDSGKRAKVKANQILLKFDKPQPSEFMLAGQAVARSMEVDMAWEFAPEDEFGFADLARDYFSKDATPSQQLGTLLCLFEAPHYFRRAGKGRFRKASAEVIQQALVAIEKKKQLQLQISAWAQQLIKGTCPTEVQAQLYKILFKPDKNAPEYKAVVEAARESQTAPLVLLQKSGAIRSAYDFHWQRFLFEHFPKGKAFPNLQAPAVTTDLPLAPVQAYSIDDSQTTEIDDALSVQGLGSNCVTVGIHIAAPALALQPGDAIDVCGRARMSTVYMPGHKITMLPETVVQTYTLQEGRPCPALSLYVSFDAQNLSVLKSETRLERVPIAANMRHDQLDAVVTEAWLSADTGAAKDTSKVAMPQPELAFLFRLAKHLKSAREVVRGKPETFNRPDYNFRLVDVDPLGPDGHEMVTITPRLRGAPLDLIVAEAMILANSTWGQWLASLGVPAIYRSQASLAPGIKVRMGTKALPHAGIGVPSYAWSTSPLRRYTDLVNQWQLIACVRHGATAALAAPFKPKDAELFGIITAFESAYSAYNTHQASMERFWTLQYLRQNTTLELEASVIKSFPGEPPLARAEHLPLVFSISGAPSLERGSRVKVRLGEMDLIALDIHVQFIESLTQTPETSEDDDDEDMTIGSITIAVDLNDAEDPSLPFPT